MDYTLAQYQQPNFDRLAFDGAKQKLVQNLGYPDDVLSFEYDHTMWARGLIIDTARGNFLKIDRHKYVRMAYHGMERMDSQTRKLLYAKSFNKVMSFTEKQFVNIDTLFQFVDAHLFALLIQLKDSGEYDQLNGKTYQEMYRQVRESVDLCHRDGVIKDEVHRHPEKYIVLDPGLVPMLRRFRAMGIKLFLVTNSLWEYTSTAMNYLYHGRRVPDEQQRTNDWLELFDLVIVGSCKPAFMLDPYLNLFRVNPQDGSLRNTDGVYEIQASSAREFLARGKTFQGGNWLHLHAMLETRSGDEILYVGDHLYSDVLRSKRTLGWRSAFIVPELPDEMRIFYEQRHVAAQMSGLRHLRDELGRQCDDLLLQGEIESSDRVKDLQYKDRLVKQKLKKLTTEWHNAFHSRWGALFNAGYQDSRFAFYVSNYACLYTGMASNLGLSSNLRSFRTPAMERLPHDRLLEESDTQFVDTTHAWDDYTTLDDIPPS
jgi:5'-nucleotidase